jgi:murein DD-endopeptidase MepM/ murein hydrolase activator NlpD
MADCLRSLIMLVAFSMAIAVSACSGSRVISTYRSMSGAEGLRRPHPHNGVDVATHYGADVLAAADGRVVRLRRNQCGTELLLSHEPFGRYTLYCHLAESFVRVGDYVKRGAVIASVGLPGSP